MSQTYKYQAKNNRGQVIQGTVQAESEAQAYHQLSKQGYFPMSFELEKAQKEKKASAQPNFFFRKFAK